MATVTIVPASGSITAKQTVCKVHVDAADQNDLGNYDNSLYPSSPEFRYYLLFDAPAGTADKKSYVFAVDENGDHDFNNFIFDAAGSWTIRLRNAATHGDVATTVVSVS